MGDPQVYVVRVWATPADPPGFRALVRGVEQAEFASFTQAEALAAFFAYAAVGAPPPGGPGSSDEPGR